MSRDKYSGSHTISVAEGSGTLEVDAALSVTGLISSDSGISVGSVQLTSPVIQKFRIGGNHFKPKSSADFTNITYNSNGALEFGTTIAYVNAPVNLPHGAYITGMRVVGKATSTDDEIVVTLSRATGTSIVAIATGTYEDVGDIDETEVATLPHNVDLSLDRFYFVRANGIEVTTSAQIYFVDILYTIDNFPQDAESTPV